MQRFFRGRFLIKKITNTFKKSCEECPKTMLKVAGDRGAIKRS